MEENPFRNFWNIFVLFWIVLAIGTLGFYIYGEKNWVQAFYDASTTMTSVGATIIDHSDQVKIFAGVFSLFSCLFILFIFAFFVGHWIQTFDSSKEKEEKKREEERRR